MLFLYLFSHSSITFFSNILTYWKYISIQMFKLFQVILIKCKSYEIEDLQLVRKVLQQMNAIFEKAKHGGLLYFGVITSPQC